MTQYTVAYGGERLDRIAKKVMQTERQGTVEALLNANPGLAASIVDRLVPQDRSIDVQADFTPAIVNTFKLAWE